MPGHGKYMNRCLELAAKGFGRVAPNPMVGCVIVYKGRIIGEGYHRKFGDAHAEVNAINSVKNKSLLKSAVLYVNLEPCAHFGKTPPCADLIIRYGIKYVIIGTLDPNPLVAGRGIHRLVSAGCDVKAGVLEEECRELNKRFFCFYGGKRPYIILKWAETADKYIGAAGSRFQISGSKANKLVHEWRSEEQAILVGKNTALCDNPRLTVRLVKGKNPLRIVIDRNLEIPSAFHLFDKKIPTIVFAGKKKASAENLEYVKIDFNRNVLQQMLEELCRRNIQSLIVEGGAKLLSSFIRENLWDEARIFTSNTRLGRKNGIASPEISGAVIARKKIGTDSLRIFRNTF